MLLLPALHGWSSCVGSRGERLFSEDSGQTRGRALLCWPGCAFSACCCVSCFRVSSASRVPLCLSPQRVACVARHCPAWPRWRALFVGHALDPSRACRGEVCGGEHMDAPLGRFEVGASSGWRDDLLSAGLIGDVVKVLMICGSAIDRDRCRHKSCRMFPQRSSPPNPRIAFAFLWGGLVPWRTVVPRLACWSR